MRVWMLADQTGNIYICWMSVSLLSLKCHQLSVVSKHQEISLSSATISLIARPGLSLAESFLPDLTLGSYWLGPPHGSVYTGIL